tara:strand:- start:48 stop:911 length:864 start_codon:yes stop_codon:yes gene_type:complete
MRDYDKVVIVCYPAGTGGNFLINCLSLTDQCVLRNSLLAIEQLMHGMTTNNKIKYLLSQLDLTAKNKKWNDLNLGCSNLFGISSELYVTEYPEIIEKNFYPCVTDLINSGKYLFIVAHSIQRMEAYQKFWTNSRVIFFTKYQQFLDNRPHYKKIQKHELINYWDIIKGNTWPNMPPVNEYEFLKLPDTIQQELTNTFKGEISRMFDYTDLRMELFNKDVDRYQQLLTNSLAFTWNVHETYHGDSTKLLTHVHQCAEWLKITISASDNDIVTYYNQWLETMDIIKKSS